MEETNWISVDTSNLQHRFEELQQRASQDALSGLLNRAAMEHCIKKRLEEMTPEDACALFIVDLDDFKQVNDTLGHQAGDQAIRQSAQILSGLFRASDIVGRLGGDEFAVFLCGKVTEELVRRKAIKICETLQLALGDHPVVNLTASVGIHLAGQGQQFDGMYQSADLALYKAKKAGKHGFCIKSRESYQEGRSDGFRPVNTIPLSGLLKEMDSGVALLEMGEYPRVIYVSPSFCRLIGADAKTYPLPQPLSGLIHPDDRVELEQALREGLRQGKAVEHAHRVSAGDGERWFWWHIRAVQIDYDNPYPVMLVTTTDISRFKESEQRLEEINQRLQVAFNQTTQRLWEVDIPSGTFSAFGQDGLPALGEDGGMRFPDQLLDSGWVHPHSAGRFREFARELLSGQSQGYGNFILQDSETGCYGWASLSYRILYDEVGRAVKAVGLVDELPKSLAGLEDGKVRRPLPEGLLSGLMVRMKANLLQDTVEELWVEGKNLGGQVRRTPCSQILCRERETIRCEEGQEAFLENLDRDRLLRLYQEGERWLSAEYRRADGSGNLRWVRHVLYLSADPFTHDPCLYVYLVRMDLSRQWELALGQGIGKNPVARLHGRETVRGMASVLFPSREPGERAVALFQADGLDKSHRGNGREPERVMGDMGAALSVALGGSCILGQYGPDQIVILFPSAPSREELRQRLEEATAFVRQVLAGIDHLGSLRFVTGVAVQPADSAQYDALLARAVHVCRQRWNAPADTVAFFQEEDDCGWTQLQAHGREDRISVHLEEMKRPLSQGERDVAFHCMSAMLSADSLEASVQGVLETIGTYYRADRVYVLLLAENRHVVTMPYEWTGAGKCSIQQTVSGMRLERFPLLKRCMAEQAPVFLTRPRPAALQEEGAAGDPWYFTTFPLIKEGQMEGFLCIENAREHPADAALFSTLIPYMLRERERFHRGQATGPAEQLMGLPNLRSYLETVYSLNSEQYASMGAVSLDIPDMAAINGSLGFEYGSKLLWYVSKTLADLFSDSLLFRTWETEFITFCPNTTQQVFLGRCNRLRSILRRRYPREVRIGYAWAGETFNGRQLAEEARAVMRSRSPRFCTSSQLTFLGRETYSTVGEAAKAGRLAVYFQPKVHIRTGSLAGAEALVRGVGEDGSAVAPAGFVHLLEEEGNIRELDLFVLDRALAQVDRWREEGLAVVPVSVNLSRVTLRHPSTLASVLAIQSRYPRLPPETLELEITESADALETGQLKEVVERFRACGLRIGLDDFGSQYANLPLFANVKFDVVKLDRGLIAGMASSAISRMLVRDIVQICQTGGMTCVAEGVETPEQASALMEAGCQYAQGYYYGRPMPAELFWEKYLRGREPAGVEG